VRIFILHYSGHKSSVFSIQLQITFIHDDQTRHRFTHFLGLVIFAPLAADKLDRLVTKYYRRRVRLHTDNQVDKPFPRLVLSPGVFFAVIGLAVETLREYS